MQLAYYRPTGRLGTLVESLTFTSGYCPAHQREILLPDGAIQIIVDMAERPKRLFDGVEADTGTDFRRAWIAGMHTRPIVIEAQPGAALFIIRFTPAGAGAVLGPSIGDLRNGVEGFDAVLGPLATELRERLLEAPTAAAKFAEVERWALERARLRDRFSPLAATAAARLQTDPALKIGDLAEEFGLSERYLRSVFVAEVGQSPKQFQRIARFQSLLAAMAPGRGQSLADLLLTGEGIAMPHWADLASQFAYVDQAHLSRDFQEFAGMSPRRYVERYRGLSSYLPV